MLALLDPGDYSIATPGAILGGATLSAAPESMPILIRARCGSDSSLQGKLCIFMILSLHQLSSIVSGIVGASIEQTISLHASSMDRLVELDAPLEVASS